MKSKHAGCFYELYTVVKTQKQVPFVENEKNSDFLRAM